MPEKIPVLARLLIFPNTSYPGSKDYIIAAVDINNECYVADTDTKSIHDTYWDKSLKATGKVQCIQDMLNCLQMAYGHRFRVIIPFDDDELEQFTLSNQ